jgi:RNA polymerase sigma-70 factor (ECF subfamily)
LHDVFGYPFTDIARITGRTAAACRQLASAARRRLRAAQIPPARPAARQAALVREFKTAWEAADIGALITLLDPAATVTADGGGLASAAPRPIEGGEQAARYLASITARAPGGVTLLERPVNGQPGLIAQHNGTTVTVLAFHITNDQITHIWAIRNPRKLRPWTTR